MQRVSPANGKNNELDLLMIKEVNMRKLMIFMFVFSGLLDYYLVRRCAVSGKLQLFIKFK
jgi:hypothetical protein